MKPTRMLLRSLPLLLLAIFFGAFGIFTVLHHPEGLGWLMIGAAVLSVLAAVFVLLLSVIFTVARRNWYFATLRFRAERDRKLAAEASVPQPEHASTDL